MYDDDIREMWFTYRACRCRLINQRHFFNAVITFTDSVIIDAVFLVVTVNR